MCIWESGLQVEWSLTITLKVDPRGFAKEKNKKWCEIENFKICECWVDLRGMEQISRKFRHQTYLLVRLWRGVEKLLSSTGLAGHIYRYGLHGGGRKTGRVDKERIKWEEKGQKMSHTDGSRKEEVVGQWDTGDLRLTDGSVSYHNCSQEERACAIS